MTQTETIVWKSVPNYKDRYEVSNTGLVRGWYSGRNKMKEPNILKPILCGNDKRPTYILQDKKMGLKDNMQAGRLVLLTFVGEPEGGQEASHLDGDFHNNCIENLVWETHYENEMRKFEHGTTKAGEKSEFSKLHECDVLEIRRLKEYGLGSKLLSKMFLVTPDTIRKIYRRNTWAHI
jgi:hypothetical protein